MDYKLKRKMMYAILREIDKGNVNISAADFDVSDDEFYEVIGLLDYEGMIKGAKEIRNVGARYPKYLINVSSITLKGMNFLDEHSNFGRFYKGLKEFKEWIPGM